MKKTAMDKQLNEVFKLLVKADKADERREYMNALLRVVAMICFESVDPETSYKVACTVIREAMDEPAEKVH